MDVPELDGFVNAPGSGPVVVPPSRWLPVVRGDFEPEWKNAKEFEAVVRCCFGICTVSRSR